MNNQDGLIQQIEDVLCFAHGLESGVVTHAIAQTLFKKYSNHLALYRNKPDFGEQITTRMVFDAVMSMSETLTQMEGTLFNVLHPDK